MIDDLLKIFDNKKYAKLAIKNKKNYLKNKPFPHIYFDNFLPKKIASTLSKEYPKIEQVDKNWKTHKNKNYFSHLSLSRTCDFKRPLLMAAQKTSGSPPFSVRYSRSEELLPL